MVHTRQVGLLWDCLDATPLWMKLTNFMSFALVTRFSYFPLIFHVNERLLWIALMINGTSFYSGTGKWVENEHKSWILSYFLVITNPKHKSSGLANRRNCFILPLAGHPLHGPVACNFYFFTLISKECLQILRICQ